MRAYLNVLDGGAMGSRVEVGAGPCIVGRAADCQVRLDPQRDAQASSRHCQVERRAGVFWVVDLNSANGTFLNGTRISEYTLRGGDVITFGVGGPCARFDVEEAQGAGRGVSIEDFAGAPILRTSHGNPSVRLAPRPHHLVSHGPSVRLTITIDGVPDVRMFSTNVIRLGRHPSNDVVFESRGSPVSSSHAKISLLEGIWTLVDLESTNGTWIREIGSEPRQITRYNLLGGETFELGTGGPRVLFEIAQAATSAAISSAEPGTVVLSPPRLLEMAERDQVQTGRIPLAEAPLTFGRDASCNVRMTEGQVSARHARIHQQGNIWFLEDLGSRNGTFLNGRAVTHQAISEGDVVLIGGRRFEFRPPYLEMYDFERGAALTTHGLSRVASGRLILDDISLSIGLGEFVALIGPSGSGKSTLLKALNGYRFADRGYVEVAGCDLYDEFDAVKQSIGYVPQDDALHQTLTVNQTLEYVARLRLPSDYSKQERRGRIDSVLSQLELIDHADKRVHQLSGGQRKRVSIGVELLTDPKVLFLDEPTSGLDPGMEFNMMRIARELACTGRTLVVTTHAMTNIALCDKLIFLVGGKLAFFGPPADALKYFGVKRAEELFIVYKDRKPEQWKSKYRLTELCRTLIPQYSGNVETSPVKTAPHVRANGVFESIRQAYVLTERYVRILLGDPWNVFLLLILSPVVISLGLRAIRSPSALSLVFALVPLFLGVQCAAKEIVREAAVYRRERMVNLGLIPYMTSKVVVLAAFAAIQTAVFLLCVKFVCAQPWFAFQPLYQILILASLAGLTAGLAISAFVRTADQPNTLIPILLITHVIGSGFFQVTTMPGRIETLFYRATSTYWVVDEIKRVIARHHGFHRGDVEARLAYVQEQLSGFKQQMDELQKRRQESQSSLSARLSATRDAVSAPLAQYVPPPLPVLPADKISVAGRVQAKRLVEQYKNAVTAEIDRLKAQAEQQMNSVKQAVEDVETERNTVQQVGKSIADVASQQKKFSDELKDLRSSQRSSVWFNHLGTPERNRPWTLTLSTLALALALFLLKLQDTRDE